ncbi:MAG: urea carboxylase-associated family protein [Deltaproteobacteria bacterium]|nr:urea carboxylase-associated family protein [Deltaproteobacteria bacterium]
MPEPIAVREIAAQSGGWMKVPAGAALRVVDVAGTQVADLFAMVAGDPGEWLSVANTRGANWALFPRVGETFLSTRYRPLLTFERDDSPGIHDMLFASCDAPMYAALGVQGYHPSCAENFRRAAGEHDWHPALVPDPVNFFQHTPVGADGSLCTRPAATRAGDSVTLRAELDLIVIVTACSMDVKDINGGTCTPIRLELLA